MCTLNRIAGMVGWVNGLNILYFGICFASDGGLRTVFIRGRNDSLLNAVTPVGGRVVLAQAILHE